MMRVMEVSGTATLAAATSAVAMVQADATGIVVAIVSGGVAAVVGYFSAQITVRSELASLKTEMRMLRQELHRYYSTRGRPVALGDDE